MLTIFVRTALVYVILIATMRLMGKRQLGELELTDLIVTLLISEIATLPIVDQNIQLAYAVIPLLTILSIELALSVLLLKFPALKPLTESRPSILVRNGRIDQKELSRNRISLAELMSEIRQAGYAGVEEISYAIVEQNGKLSVLPRRAAQPPDAQTLGMTPKEPGILHLLIEDGKRNTYNLNYIGLDDAWLDNVLAREKVREEEVFLLGRDDLGSLYWVKKEKVK